MLTSVASLLNVTPTRQILTPNIYSHIISRLAGHYAPRESQAIARILIEDLLHLPLSHAMAGITPMPSVQERQTLDCAISRLLANEPIQYILGKTSFRSNTLLVNPSVLIPRPETEQLIDIALSLPFPTRAGKTDGTQISDIPTVMDACTGSGCIAIALKTEQPLWTIHACDISTEALQVARENASLNNVAINFHHTDLLSANTPSGPYHLIVSNPPYVMDKEKSSMEPHVLNCEPHLALFVPDDTPLVFYEALANWGNKSLLPAGWLLAEINPQLSQETKKLFETHQYSDCTIINDNYGKERFIRCRK